MIVFDSSTLILLAKSELLDVFIKNYKGVVLISREVEKESTIKKTYDALLIKNRIEEGKIKVRELMDDRLEKIMRDFSINKGEAESILLSLNEKADVIALDDKNAINACKLLNVSFTTAIGILMRSREKGLITLDDAKMKLRLLSKYGRYREEIINDANRRLE